MAHEQRLNGLKKIWHRTITAERICPPPHTHTLTHTYTHIRIQTNTDTLARHISDVNNTHIPERFFQQVQTESGETITLTTTFNISEGLKQPNVADGRMFN